jgi:hypothetical protein
VLTVPSVSRPLAAASIFALLLAAPAVTSCRGETITVVESKGPTSGAGAGGAGGATSSASSSGGGNAIAGPVVAPQIDKPHQIPFTFSTVGTGSSFVGSVSVNDGVGTVQLGNANVPVVVYEKQPFKDFTLYQSLAIASDRWYVVWFYCLGGDLQGVYYESTDGTAITTEGASGACVEGDQPNGAPVMLPASEIAYPSLEQGFSVDGPAVSYDGSGPGAITLGGVDYALLPFTSVDCTLCGGPGWWELHSLLWNGSSACFAILYLQNGSDPMQLDYALCLPGLDDPFGAVLLDGSWSK